MLRYKTNKQSVILAAIVILLCFACLTGATLALFTSDVNDGTIGIVTTSGDVEVDIVDAITGVSLVGEYLEFRTVQGEEILFEPGATVHTQGFKIENDGDVPINFRLDLSKDEVTDEDDNVVDMQKFKEAFDVWISTDPNDPTAAVPLEPFVGKLGIEEGARLSGTYYLFVRMKDTADNEFQGKSYKGIGVTVFAVQGNAIMEE